MRRCGSGHLTAQMYQSESQGRTEADEAEITAGFQEVGVRALTVKPFQVFCGLQIFHNKALQEIVLWQQIL